MNIYKDATSGVWLEPCLERETKNGIVTELREIPFGSIVLNVVNTALSAYRSESSDFPEKLKKDVLQLSECLTDLQNIRKNGNTGIQDREFFYKMFGWLACELYGITPQEPICNGHDLINHDGTLLPVDTFILPEQAERAEITCIFPAEIFLFSEDLWLLLFSESTPKIRRCSNCDQLYFSNNFKAKYCPACKSIMGKIRYQNRKQHTARALHTKILNLLYLKYGGSCPEKSAGMTSDISNAFLAESNYYWDIVNGRNPQPNPDYNADIQTETDYIRWLESKKAEISRTKKGR